jgi:hypothetical protein
MRLQLTIYLQRICAVLKETLQTPAFGIYYCVGADPKVAYCFAAGKGEGAVPTTFIHFYTPGTELRIDKDGNWPVSGTKSRLLEIPGEHIRGELIKLEKGGL